MTSVEKELNHPLVRYFFENVRTYSKGWTAQEQFSRWVKFSNIDDLLKIVERESNGNC